MSHRSDRVFLTHMLEEVSFILDHAVHRSFDSLTADEVLQRAVLRSLEVIGEAAKNLTSDVREQHPEVDWRRIAGLRDVLIHQYFSVSWPIVWDIIQTKLPPLRRHLHAIIRQQDES